MRIKKLELIGFKSFKDRTVIHFDAGITGIVGPNGCGKSNIVDALVWVMGEMSAKHLRGSSMEDVIFAGAEGYAPMGLAEVSLTLENDGGPFPAQYAKHSEIMITRRLHRSGESEYLINKETARLKDVQEVFMDTGAGSKGFSIIEQGAIGRIITAKPEDRRTLIEEAAGITKFKVRKRESQRKLQSTDQNLVRLADIIGELKRQLGSLERQAQRAERYRKLKTEIEELDLWVSAKTYLSLKAQADEAQRALDEASANEASSGADFSEAEIRLEQLKAVLAEQELEVTATQQEHFDYRSSVQKKELAVRELQFEIEQARRSNEMTGSMLQQNTTRRELLQNDFQDLSERVERLRAETGEITQTFEARDDVYRSQQARINECDDELTSRRREMLTVSQSESHLDAKVVSIQDQIDSIQEREENARSILMELEAKSQEFEQHRDDVSSKLTEERQTHADVVRTAEALLARREDLTARIEEKRRERDEFKDRLNQVASRLYGLEDLQSNFEGFEAGVKNVMLWSRKRAEEHPESVHFQPVAEVVEVPAEYEVAMEAALGNRLQVLLAPNTDVSLSAVDYLKENKSGRSSFMSESVNTGTTAPGDLLQEDGVRAALAQVVTAPPSHQKAVAHILKDVIVVESLRTALGLRSRYPGYTFVTVDGDVLSHDGVLTGGAAESADSGVLKRRREIRDLSEQKEEWAGKLSLAQAVLQTLEGELSEAVSELEGAQQSRADKEIRLAELKKDLERAENEGHNAKVAIDRQNREVSQISEQSVRLQDQLDEFQENLLEYRERKIELEGQIGSLDRELQEARSGIDSLQSEVTQLRVQSASKQQEMEGVTRQLQMVEKSLGEVNAQLSQMSEETDKNSQVLSESQTQLEGERVQLDRLIHEAQEAEMKLARARDEYEATLADSRELEKSVSAYLHERAQIERRINEARLRFEQFKMKEENIVVQIRERYMLDLPGIAQERSERETGLSESEAEASLKDLREKISRIGEVNLSAIEEYDDLAKRYEFLSQQQTDLLDAKEQLRKVIDRINRICSRRFKETFDAVNERFIKVFPVLFGGGEARLTLIEDPEKGEMGIEIVAKPPGKKMVTVSLMSGGEKALTAVALIFSIFLVKPSPYCLLDEVDAPLDDANVFRFNDLVKEMAKRSQIIVVTHNKHTMEVSEKLYGVTMQEKGVSKMVSVSLADAQQAV